MVTRINPLVTALRQRGMLLGVGILLLALAAVAITSWWPPLPEPSQPTPSQPSFLADLPKIEDHPIENPGFVGPQACVGCHRELVHEFQQTRHFQAMAKPDVEFMSKAFSTHAGSWQTQDPTRRFEMQRAGTAFTQTAISTASGTEQRTTTEIALFTEREPA